MGGCASDDAWAQFAAISADGMLHVLDQQAYLIVRARSPFRLQATRTLVETRPEGRTITSLLDSLGRTTEVRRTGFAPVKYTFGPRGFLLSVTQAGRQVKYAYDSITSEDPLHRVEQYAYDSVGRVTTQTLVDGRTITYTYDATGNLTSLTPPYGCGFSKFYHSFSLNSVTLPRA